MSRRRMLARVATNMVGVNSSNTEIVNRMRRVVDGEANGEAWCVCFVQWGVREVDALLAEAKEQSQALVHRLPLTESTQRLWALAPDDMKTTKPEIGAIAVWRSIADPMKGHCAVVTATVGYGDGPPDVFTVEGNTSATGGTSEAERNGNGIWPKRRLKGGQIPGFVLLGYLLPWGVEAQ